MRIAYIILFHKNFEQTNLLINQLDDGNCDFTVYDYVFLLSGQDFPIKSNVEIQRFLTENGHSNFIEVVNHADKTYSKCLKRNSLKYRSCMMRRSFFSRLWKSCIITVTGGETRTFKIFKRKNPFNFAFEFGSQWWALTFECFRWILDYVETHPEYVAYYKNCLVPDESFFITLFMASPFKNTRKDYLTYLEWEENGNHPRVFADSDFDLLMKQKSKLFARKFDSSVDKSIIDKIIKRIKNQNINE